MTPVSIQYFESYWTMPFLEVNAEIFINLLGALLLGMLVGYERSYHGRAAGMRTYGLVCMASTALTVIIGYPGYWFGGHAVIVQGVDPTRVIQGIVTGVGFLGAGIIMKDGFNISGLTSAASIWASSAIGVMIGVGFYASALLLSLLSATCMMWGPKLESWLPSRHAVSVVLKYASPPLGIEVLRAWLSERHYQLAEGTLSIIQGPQYDEWHFVVVDISQNRVAHLDQLAEDLRQLEGVSEFQLSHARN
jgi:putative Mg2+ transporter-C (MgtC) family protein